MEVSEIVKEGVVRIFDPANCRIPERRSSVHMQYIIYEQLHNTKSARHGTKEKENINFRPLTN